MVFIWANWYFFWKALCTGPNINSCLWFGEVCSCCYLNLPATFSQPRTSVHFGPSICFQGELCHPSLILPLLALLGNKNWPPSMKLKKLEIFWSKMGSMGCKWSSLNAPGTENPLSHSILNLEWISLSHVGGCKLAHEIKRFRDNVQSTTV